MDLSIRADVHQTDKRERERPWDGEASTMSRNYRVPQRIYGTLGADYARKLSEVEDPSGPSARCHQDVGPAKILVQVYSKPKDTAVYCQRVNSQPQQSMGPINHVSGVVAAEL